MWLVEGPQQSAAQHVQNCWTCQAKLAEAQGPLTAFRTALVNWSEAQTATQPLILQTASSKSKRHRGPRLWLPAASFALAALLLVGYAKVPGLFHGHPNAQQPLVAASTVADSDEALLDQVDSEVSEAVPDAMAPLTDLVAWDSTEGSGTGPTSTEKHVTRKTLIKGTNAKTHVDVAN